MKENNRALIEGSLINRSESYLLGFNSAYTAIEELGVPKTYQTKRIIDKLLPSPRVSSLKKPTKGRFRKAS